MALSARWQINPIRFTCSSKNGQNSSNQEVKAAAKSCDTFSQLLTMQVLQLLTLLIFSHFETVNELKILRKITVSVFFNFPLCKNKIS